MQLIWYLAGQRPELARLRAAAARRDLATRGGRPGVTHRPPAAATSQKEH
ncbi:hypothetical protein ACGGZK_18710 [Agromyces sp. MMS24-K17]